MAERGSRSLLALAGGGAIALAVVALLASPVLGGFHVGTLANLSGSAGAASHQLVTANFSGNFTITKRTVVNNVTYLVATTVRSVTGNMTGVEVAYEWGAVQANGSMWVSGIGTFVGTVRGSAPGLLTLTWQHVTGVFGVSLAGMVHVSDGQKGLTGIHGEGPAKVVFTGGFGFDGSYALNLDLD